MPGVALTALVIGTGYAGTKHAEALREIGVVVQGPVSAREAMRDADVAMRGDADVVHVCAANELHFPLASAALRAGKHVICEKPLTLDLVSAAGLAHLAEQRTRAYGQRAFVAYNYRFYPLIWEIIGRIAAGELGRIQNVRVSFLQEWLLEPPRQTWRFDPGPGGVSRIVADLGSHCVDLVEAVLDTTSSAVVADVAEHHGTMLVEVGAVRAAITMSQVSAGHANDVELAVDGTHGAAVWRFGSRDALELVSRGGRTTITRAGPFVSPYARELADRAAGPNEARRNLLDSIYQRLRGDEGPFLPVPTFFDGMRHVRLAAAALTSHRERRWVDLLDPPARAMATLRPT